MSQFITNMEVFWPYTSLETPISDSTSTFRESQLILVCLTTNEGLTGYGTISAINCVDFLNKTLKPLVIGKNPLAYEDIWQTMHNAVRSGGRKGVALCAMSAIDIAIWDLRGKILGLPVYRLLGGENRLIPAYSSGGWTSYSIEELLEELTGFVRDGYSVVKMKVGVENGKNLREDARRVEAVRRAVGEDVEIIIDANNVWDASTAIRFADMISDYEVMLFEEPVTADDIPGLRRVRSATTIPIATGENEYTKYGCRDLLLGEAVDVVQLDIGRAGGFTEMQKISAMVQAWNLRLAPHAWELLSAHILSPAPHALFVERLTLQQPIFNKTMINHPIPRNGLLEIPDQPGIGIDFDMEFIRKNNKLGSF